MLDLSTNNAGLILALFLIWEIFQVLKEISFRYISVFFPVESQKD